MLVFLSHLSLYLLENLNLMNPQNKENEVGIQNLFFGINSEQQHLQYLHRLFSVELNKILGQWHLQVEQNLIHFQIHNIDQ